LQHVSVFPALDEAMGRLHRQLARAGSTRETTKESARRKWRQLPDVSDPKRGEAVIQNETTAATPKKNPIKRCVRNVDQLAKLFGLPSSEDVHEATRENVADAGHFAYEYAIKEGRSEEEAERAREEAEDEEGRDIQRKWYDGVTDVAEHFFEAHLLRLVPLNASYERHAYEFQVLPAHGKTWRDAANAIRETINGAGPFYFASLREFLTSGPYTPYEAVIQHFGWIPDHAEVYGTGETARRIYDRAWR
jgi:hypothetical protein